MGPASADRDRVPAIDVANLLVHLELRVMQGHCGSEVAVVAGDAFLEAYRPDRDLRGRIDAYAAATRLRLACVYAFRPCWRHLGAHLLSASQTLASTV